MPRLEDMSPMDIQECDFEDLKDIRREAFERLAVMMGTPEIDDWAANMAVKYNAEKCVIYHNHPLSWQACLAIVRYGEAPVLADGTKFWPDAFGADDLVRAKAWLRGKDIPQMVRPVTE